MRARGALLAVVLAAGCQTTTDSLGGNEAGALQAVHGPPSYQNVLKDVLGFSDAMISTKISGAFSQLFDPDPTPQSIYVVSSSDPMQAYIMDVLHGQVRSEGQGLGMMIAVQLNKQDVFDHLWRYAKMRLAATGVNTGYFNSYCDSADQSRSSPCLDPFGLEQFVTALIFAYNRWGSSTGGIDYQADALSLFHTIRYKVQDNGGPDSGVTNTFDSTALLPYSVPDVSSAGVTRASIVMPGYYAIWAQADDDQMFADAATSGRTFLKAAAHPSSGLTPIRSTFDGAPVSGWAVFDPEAYRAQINLVIDQLWTGTSHAAEADRLLAFFTSEGINTYGTAYTWDGNTCTNPMRELSLVVANGVAAAISTRMDRMSYLSAFWNMPTPTGNSRYYAGLMQLWGLLILGGQFHVY